MINFERFLEEKLNPIHKAHYALWVYWWPIWRDIYSKRSILRKWEQLGFVQDGQIFLDYGCGTGDFTVVAAKLVGTEGKVYALDCFSRQLSIVKKKSRKKGLNNVVTILSDGTTGLSDASVDVVWMCDVFHEVREKRALLEELRRVLKEDGELVVYDAMREGILRYTSGLFSLTGRDDKLLRFAR